MLVDIVLLIDFFGYVIESNIEIAKQEFRKGKIIIYDSTHKIDGNLLLEAYVDYYFCSYRKWFYCNFAKVVKHKGRFNINTVLAQNECYIKLRDEAAKEKENYIEKGVNNKASFLMKFSEAEKLLDIDYIGYKGIETKFNLSQIVSTRKENAKYLIEELKKIPYIDLWKTQVTAVDTPMFVSILLEDENVRNALRKELVDNSIYCPVHWPKCEYHVLQCGWPELELSLICAQRYDVDDMECMIQVIKKFSIYKDKREKECRYIHIHLNKRNNGIKSLEALSLTMFIIYPGTQRLFIFMAMVNLCCFITRRRILEVSML